MDQKETGKKHLKDQFLNQIASEILEGKLKPGDRLPTERKLAGEAMISQWKNWNGWASSGRMPATQRMSKTI